MPTLRKMSISSRREYLKVQQERYREASRRERSQLLDEMVSVTCLNRKYIIQLMGTDLARKPRQRERGRLYGEDVEAATLVVAETLDFRVCFRMFGLSPIGEWV